jgi:hypothetical protein
MQLPDVPNSLDGEGHQLLVAKYGYFSIRILVDGQQFDTCVSYDIDAGTVVYYPKDETGNVILDGDEIKVETVTGKVEVEFYERK